MEIKRAMEAKKIGVDALAGLLNVHRNTAANKLNGDTPFTFEEAYKIKRSLFPEYDLDYLFSPEPQDDDHAN